MRHPDALLDEARSASRTMQKHLAVIVA